MEWNTIYKRDQRERNSSFPRLLGNVMMSNYELLFIENQPILTDYSMNHLTTQLICDSPDALHNENKYLQYVFRKSNCNSEAFFSYGCSCGATIAKQTHDLGYTCSLGIPLNMGWYESIPFFSNMAPIEENTLILMQNMLLIVISWLKIWWKQMPRKKT